MSTALVPDRVPGTACALGYKPGFVVVGGKANCSEALSEVWRGSVEGSGGRHRLPDFRIPIRAAVAVGANPRLRRRRGNRQQPISGDPPRRVALPAKGGARG